MDSAVQAIQQAPDPSAAIAAYANGFATDPNAPQLYDAYVKRMVDLGLPEMAYHQAQTLTTLQANNGLAWGVVAYVAARRGQMPDAISAINLAGRFAPDNHFVQHTAGELAAWYDLKADKSSIPDVTKEGLSEIRAQLDRRPDFSEAYATAQKAYQAPASSATQPQSGPAPVYTNLPATSYVVPQVDQIAPLGYSAPAVAPIYPDYSYLDWGSGYYSDWGPGWVAPAPWAWWEPCGYWSGPAFFPFFGVSFVFGDFDDFHHFHHFDHDGFRAWDRGTFARGGHDPAFWHHDPRSGRNSFFGTPARPNTAVTQWARASARYSSGVTDHGGGSGARSWTETGYALRSAAPQPATSGAGRVYSYFGSSSASAARAYTPAPASRTWSHAAPGYARSMPSLGRYGGLPMNSALQRSYSAFGGFGGSPSSSRGSGFGSVSHGGFGGGLHGGGFSGGFHAGGSFAGSHGGGHR